MFTKVNNVITVEDAAKVAHVLIKLLRTKKWYYIVNLPSGTNISKI